MQASITNTTVVSGAAFDNDSLLAQLKANQLYVNVHTTEYPAGEIACQLTCSGKACNM